jgi:hypothetical protein
MLPFKQIGREAPLGSPPSPRQLVYFQKKVLRDTWDGGEFILKEQKRGKEHRIGLK